VGLATTSGSAWANRRIPAIGARQVVHVPARERGLPMMPAIAMADSATSFMRAGSGRVLHVRDFTCQEEALALPASSGILRRMKIRKRLQPLVNDGAIDAVGQSLSAP
jgi:hypothetical protein